MDIAKFREMYRRAKTRGKVNTVATNRAKAVHQARKNAKKTRALELYESGRTRQQIAEIMQIPQSTINKYIQETYGP